MSEQTKLVAKIKKLLALAGNNSSEAEAKAALVKAQELMAEAGIEVSLDENEKIEYGFVVANTPMNKGFRTSLAVIIARNFRCQVIMHGNLVAFFGHKNDTIICKDAFEFAYRTAKANGDKEYGRCQKAGIETKNVFNSYVLGFLHGISVALDAQCKALMIVVPQDVKEQFVEQCNPKGEYKGGLKNNKHVDFNQEAYTKGQVDGKGFYTKKGIESK